MSEPHNSDVAGLPGAVVGACSQRVAADVVEHVEQLSAGFTTAASTVCIDRLEKALKLVDQDQQATFGLFVPLQLAIHGSSGELLHMGEVLPGFNR